MGWSEMPKLFATIQSAKKTLAGLKGRAKHDQERYRQARYSEEYISAYIVNYDNAQIVEVLFIRGDKDLQ